MSRHNNEWTSRVVHAPFTHSWLKIRLILKLELQFKNFWNYYITKCGHQSKVHLNEKKSKKLALNSKWIKDLNFSFHCSEIVVTHCAKLLHLLYVCRYLLRYTKDYCLVWKRVTIKRLCRVLTQIYFSHNSHSFWGRNLWSISLYKVLCELLK